MPMPSTLRIASLALILGVSGVTAAGAEAQAPAQAAVWQTHHAEFDFFAVASRYTCDSLELKVRQILEYLGAKPGVYVVATGCPRGPESLTRSAFVRVDFSTLVAAPEGGNSADTIPAAWTPTRLVAQRPTFMGDGDCELIGDMRKLLTDSFSWKGQLAYRVSCPVETVEMLDYSVQGEVLKASVPLAH
jgi:hypothetical protein